jgi:tRNA A37 methylthiotransferase MiaB
MNGGVFLITAEVGCKPNAIYLSRVARYLRANVIPISDSLESSRFVVVNTCGFDDEHEGITLDAIADAFRRKRPEATILSMGCLNVINRAVLEERFPELVFVDKGEDLDRALGATTPFDTVSEAYLDESLIPRISVRGGNQTLRVRSAVGYGRFMLELHRRLGSPHLEDVHFRQVFEEITRARTCFVQIGSGCVGRCSYCIIKKAKGGPASRAIAQILHDIEAGHRDGEAVNLVADDCGSYGVDTGDSLFDLVAAISERFPDLPLDLCYVNPFWLVRQTDQYLAMFRDARIRSVNVSMQSGSDRVLKKMNRQYRVEQVTGLLAEIRGVSPQTMLWTHFLVNFPSETWGEYRQTLALSDHFDMYYTYVYSRREGTPSARMTSDTSYRLGRLKKELLYLRLASRIFSKLNGPSAALSLVSGVAATMLGRSKAS